MAVSGPYEFPDNAPIHPIWPEYIKRRAVLQAKIDSGTGLTPAEQREIEWAVKGQPYLFMGCTFMTRPLRYARYFSDGVGFARDWYLVNNPANWPGGVYTKPGEGIFDPATGQPVAWTTLVRGKDYPQEPPFTTIMGQLHAMPEPWDVQIQRVLGREYGDIGH